MLRVRSLLLLIALPLVSHCACGERTVVDECETTTDCEGDEVCLVASDGHLACAVTGEKVLGESCETDIGCASGLCLGDENGFFCAQLCEGDDGCPAEERCYVVDHRSACLGPLDDRGTGEACETPRHCASGVCVRLDGGDIGVCLDECDPNVGCSGERNCVALDEGGHACIATVPDGSECSTPLVCQRGRCITDIGGDAICTGPCDENGSCATGWLCVDDSDGAPVCMPLLDDKAPGEACGSARECTSGHCARFATDSEDFGTLCADVCLPDDTCADEALVCWEVSDELGLCGPFPS